MTETERLAKEQAQAGAEIPGSALNDGCPLAPHGPTVGPGPGALSERFRESAARSTPGIPGGLAGTVEWMKARGEWMNGEPMGAPELSAREKHANKREAGRIMQELGAMLVPTEPTDLDALPAAIRSGVDPQGHRWPKDTESWTGYRCLRCGTLVEETYEGVPCPGELPAALPLTDNGGVNAIGHSLTITTEDVARLADTWDEAARRVPWPPPNLPADTPQGTLVTLSGLAGVCAAARALLNELRRCRSGDPVDVFDVTQWALTPASGQAAQELLLALRRAGL